MTKEDFLASLKARAKFTPAEVIEVTPIVDETCKIAHVAELSELLGEMRDEMEMVGGGKMVGGYTTPIEHLVKLNSWIAKKEDWTSCIKWLLTLIWEECYKIYNYTSGGFASAFGIIKDVGLTALGHTNTETFKFTANAFYDLYSAGSEAVNTAALSAYPYFRAIEGDVKKILKDNLNEITEKFPDVVTHQQFQEWLDNTSMFNKIYWTLVTLKSYQVGNFGTRHTFNRRFYYHECKLLWCVNCILYYQQ